MDVNVERYSWYSYYLPMLFIPQEAVQMAVLLGQPEEYTLPKWSKLLYIPTTLCFLLVLTNDFHQLVFSFRQVKYGRIKVTVMRGDIISYCCGMLFVQYRHLF